MAQPSSKAPGFRMVSLVHVLLERVRDFRYWFAVSLECDQCDRTMQIDPSPTHHFAPGLRLSAMLTGHSCPTCGVPFSRLVLSLVSRGSVQL